MRIAAGSPLKTLRLQGELYDAELPGLESVAVVGTWEKIRNIVNVVDEWQIEDGERTQWTIGLIG